MSTIKPKTGPCPMCSDGLDKPLIAGKCKPHYWQYRSSIKPAKAKSKPRKAIKKVSDKQAKRNAAYSAAVAIWKADPKNQWCCFPGCNQPMQDCHHPAGRLGENLLNLSDCKPLCREHHSYVHDKMSAGDAKRLGLKK